MKKLIAILLTIMLLVGVTACGGSGADNLTGTWELSAMDDGTGTIVTMDDMLQQLEELGLTPEALGITFNTTLTLGDDDSVVFDVFGEITEGTWEAKDGNTAAITVDGDTVDFVLDGGELVGEQDGTKMVFVKK